jgi:glycerol uptake facilitator-like aquaporin
MSGTFTVARRLTAEALGTGLLVATVVGSGIMAEKLAAGMSPSHFSATRSRPERS